MIAGKSLLIIGAGEQQKLAVQIAKKMGLFVIVSDINAKAPAIKIADDFILASTYNPEETVRAVLKYQKKRKIDAVIAVGIDAPHTVSAVAKTLRLNAYSAKTAKLAINKLLMKYAFKKKGVAIPWFSEVKSLSHLKRIVDNNKKKLVIKPQDSRGGRGVLQLNKAISLEWAYNTALSHSPTKKIMVEEFLLGPQLSTESFIYKGKVYTPGLLDRNYEYIKKFAPYFIENGGEQPTKLSKKTINKVNKLVEKAAAAIGISNGIIKGDIVIHRGEPKIIEIAARLSGNYMATFQIPKATGINLVEVAIKFALREKINPEVELIPKFNKGMAIRYWFPNPGKVIKIEGLEKLSKFSWIKYYNIEVKKGSTVLEPTDLTKRVGFVICEGKNRGEAIRRAKNAIEMVKIQTK